MTITKMRGWVVELEDGMWFVSAHFDIVRSCFSTLEAKKFLVEKLAKKCLKRSRKSKPYPDAKIYIVNRSGEKSFPGEGFYPFRRK